MHIEPIGLFHSCFPQKFGTPRQPVSCSYALSYLQVHPQFQPEIALEGLAEFSHAWLIFEFHKVSQERFKAKIHAPRFAGGSVGVFATRSPHRPNRLGLSLLTMFKVQPEQGRIYFSGADIVDETPVFDLKPYLPGVESIATAASGWVQQAANLAKKVQWEASLDPVIDRWLLDLAQDPKWVWPWGREQLVQLITEVLSQDPRPRAYRNGEPRFRETAIVPLYNRDLHVRFAPDSDLVVLEKITPYRKPV